VPTQPDTLAPKGRRHPLVAFEIIVFQVNMYELDTHIYDHGKFLHPCTLMHPCTLICMCGLRGEVGNQDVEIM
jgi:hypothetical protein